MVSSNDNQGHEGMPSAELNPAVHAAISEYVANLAELHRLQAALLRHLQKVLTSVKKS